MPIKQLSETEIIRQFAAQAPAYNADGECAYCSMPGVAEVIEKESVEEDRTEDDMPLPDGSIQRLVYRETETTITSRLRPATPAPHLHFPDCAWRNAVELTERAQLAKARAA